MSVYCVSKVPRMSADFDDVAVADIVTEREMNEGTINEIGSGYAAENWERFFGI